MKRITRAEFLKLPAGVFYSKAGGPHCYGSDQLAVKGDSMLFKDSESGGDWVEIPLAGICGNDASETDQLRDRMLSEGISVPLSDASCRDGLFDVHETFYVYEMADLIVLAGYLREAISAERIKLLQLTAQ